MRSLLFGAILATAVSVLAAEKSEEGVALTIYNQNFGVVRERRKVDLKKKLGTIRFTNVAAQIDGTSVSFKSLTDPDATVLEQNYEYDLASTDKLLQKYFDKQLTILTKDGSRYSGTLLSYDGYYFVIRQFGEKGDVVMLNRDNLKDIQFGALAEGLVTKPALVWKLSTEKPGPQLIEVTYHTEGIRWQADYSAVLNANDTAFDLSGWVTIDNQSGATYKDAKLKLIAGDVLQPPEGITPSIPLPLVEAAFFEYHLYTLPRPTTIAQNQTNQIVLLKIADVPVKKAYVYDGLGECNCAAGEPTTNAFYNSREPNKKVNVIIEFKNSKENHMGMALPQGKVRLYKRDETDGTLEFIGADEIDHTPKDETVKLKAGNAFDIVGDHKWTNYKLDTGSKTMTESFEIRIRNHKDETVDVLVKEVLYRWNNWEIVEASQKWTKYDSQTIHFNVSVPKDGETVVTYTVRYTW